MKGLADGHQVGGLATPAAVIVETELAPEFRGFLCERDEGCSRSRDIRRLTGLPRAGEAIPDLGMEVVLAEEPEGLLVATPEGKVFDTVFLILQDLFLELCDVPRAPVVGAAFQSQLSEHCGSFRGAALASVEWHDAPGDQLVPSQVGRQLKSRAARSSQHEQLSKEKNGSAGHDGC